MGLLNRIVVVVLILLGSSLASMADVLFYILTKSIQWFQFLHILVNTCYLIFFFNNSHPNSCEAISHCGFDFTFP